MLSSFSHDGGEDISLLVKRSVRNCRFVLRILSTDTLRGQVFTLLLHMYAPVKFRNPWTLSANFVIAKPFDNSFDVCACESFATDVFESICCLWEMFKEIKVL